MTATVTQPEEEPRGRGVTPRPVILALNCASAAEYLNENEVLMCLGLNHIRFNVQIDARYTSVEAASEHMADIHREVGRDLTWNEMHRHVHDTDWLAREVGVFIDDDIKNHTLKRWYEPGSVKVVLVHAELLEGDRNVMKGLLTSRYPDATFFGIGHQQFGHRPRRLWNDRPWVRGWTYSEADGMQVPVCGRCGNMMRPVGKSFVCTGCGDALNLEDQPTGN